MTPERPRRSNRRASSRRRPAGRCARCARRGQEATWRPLAVRAFAESLGTIGPRTGAPQPRLPRTAHRVRHALPPRPGPGRRCPGSTSAQMAEPLRGRGVVIVGGQSPRPPDPDRVLALADRLGWPVMADPRSGSRVEGTIAAADAIVRTKPPLPDTIVMLGTPWLSRALGEYVSDAAHAGARVIVVDPWRQWADPTRVATEFHRSATNPWLTTALEGASPCDAGVARLLAPARGEGASGHRRSPRDRPERTAGRSCRPSARRQGWRHDRRVRLHADPRSRVVRPGGGCSAPGAGESRRERNRRRRVDGVGGRDLGVRIGTATARLPSSVTWPSFTTSRDWSTCPTFPARSSSSTTAGEGSSRSCLKPPRRSGRVRAALRHAAHQ